MEILLAQQSGDGNAFAGLVLIAVGIAFYFLPSIVAGARHVPNVGSVVILNFFLGWTLIGWVVALAMAARSVPQAHFRETAGAFQRDGQWWRWEGQQLLTWQPES